MVVGRRVGGKNVQSHKNERKIPEEKAFQEFCQPA